MPAYFNGIFGHKPSRNIVSNEGQYPVPESDLLNSFLGKNFDNFPRLVLLIELDH